MSDVNQEYLLMNVIFRLK